MINYLNSIFFIPSNTFFYLRVDGIDDYYEIGLILREKDELD